MRAAEYVTTLTNAQMAEVEGLLPNAGRREQRLADLEPGNIYGFDSIGGPAAIRLAEIIAPKLAPKFYFAMGGASGEETPSWDRYLALTVNPHTDDVRYDYTVGLIIEGAHWLYTGRSRRAVELRRGVVYVLCNKRTHAARPITEDSNDVLDFIAFDFYAGSPRDALRLVT